MGDMEKLAFDFDFIGIQNYTREEEKNIWYIPYMHGLEINPEEKGRKRDFRNGLGSLSGEFI
jgi:beta-glucosidase